MIASDSVLLSDSSGESALVAATRWVEAGLLGSLATAVAVIAVASVGIMLLQGRLPARRGLSVVAGAFLVFGAAQIAGGLRSIGSEVPPSGTQLVREVPSQTPEATQQTGSPATGFDPYAGAAYIPPR